MNCNGFYEAEILDEQGNVVDSWEGKNTVNYGFIGGLYKQLFGVGNTSALITDPNSTSKTPYSEKSQFGKLYLFTSSTTPAADETDSVSTYTTDTNATKDLTGSGTITYYNVAFDVANKKITMTIQVTYLPAEGVITGQSSTSWYSMGIGSIPVVAQSNASRLVSRVKMGTGITKTTSQTLRVRYNFSIVVQ